MMNFHKYFANAILFFLIFLTGSSIAQQASIWDQVSDEIKETNSFKRFEWFYRQRAVPFDTIPSQVYFNELQNEMQKAIDDGYNSLNNLQWTPIGPTGINSGFPAHWGEMSGRVRGLAVHPTNPNIV